MTLFPKLFLKMVLAFTAILLVAHSSSALTFKSGNSSKHDDVQKRTPVKMQPSPIDGLTFPYEWPFDPSNTLSKANREHLSVELQDDSFLSGGQADRCGEIGAANPSAEELSSCIEVVALEFYRSGSMAHFEPTLVNIAKTDPLTYITKANDFSAERYNARAVMSVYGSFYAYYYDYFQFDNAIRQLVDDYFEKKFTYLNMDAVGEYRNQRFCDPRKPKRIGLKSNVRADLNTCESNRWKATIAQLLLGMRLKNETLFERGIYNTKFMLLLFDDEGIFVPWAVRGALAIHYSNEVPRFLSKLTEIYHAIGYDFLEHELENGLRVKDLYKTYFKIYDNKNILNKYAKRRYAEKGEDYVKYKKRSTEEELRRWNLTKENFARESMRYITSYRPDLENLIACDFRLRLQDYEPQRLVSSFSAVDTYEFYLANFPDNLASEEYCSQLRSNKIETEVKQAAESVVVDVNVEDTEKTVESEPLNEDGEWTLMDLDVYGPEDQVFLISYFVKSRGDVNAVLEAEDIVVFSGGKTANNKGSIKPILRLGDITEDTTNSGRENLSIKLSKAGKLMISGKIQIFEGDPFIRLEIEALEKSGQQLIPWVAGDEVIVSWEEF